jgi:hypothetical protein
MPKDYEKLIQIADYDREAVEQMADALNEIAEHQRRVAYLEQLVEENPELRKYVWRTAKGDVYALHNLEDDHLANIMRHMLSTGRAITREIRAEARQRNIEEPAPGPYMLEAEIVDDTEDIW